MLNQIESALKEIAAEFADGRLQLCQVTAVKLEDGVCALSGQVLDTTTAEVVTGRLADGFPEVSWDVSQLQVLRRDSSPSRMVVTNLTGLYAQPSFRSEMVSQVLNGWSLEILIEEGSWCFVRQPDGYLGWVYRSYVGGADSPTPTHLVVAPTGRLRAEPAAGAKLITRVLAGTAVPVLSQQDGWARLTLAGELTGWLPADELRPLKSLPAGEAARRKQISQDGFTFIGVPYLWGGGTALGIDCSGLAQLLHRLAGVALPRDADLQYGVGRPVEEPFQPGDLLFFGGKGAHRDISHVAISLGGWRILHASRAVNGVYTDDLQTNASLRQRFVGARTFLA